jgi:hypothetical protein
MNEEINMTKRELGIADTFSQISQHKISQTKAAKVLGVSVRHVQRLYSKFKTSGITSLISHHRGKPSNHQLPKILKSRIKELITCEAYTGFGPTFMCEKLKELHKIVICPETTRQLMIRGGVWEANKKKCPVVHQQRKRRARFGELIQIDGSPHAWFEDRGDPCVLIVFIDDATGRTYGSFFKSETTEAYMVTTWEYIIKNGRPLAFYSDKYGVFRINMIGCIKKESMTQFGRACKELDIGLLYANSPQAKGRVERNNKTQQDRLVKELRLKGINTIEKANQFLHNEYWDIFNQKFSVEPELKENAHRELLPEHDLEKILCYKTYRIISKNLEVQYNNTIYQIALKKPSWSLRKAKVTIIEGLTGQVYIEYKGKYLPFKIYYQQEFKGTEVNSKEIDRFLKEKRQYHVAQNHPWNQEGKAEVKKRDWAEL